MNSSGNETSDDTTVTTSYAVFETLFLYVSPFLIFGGVIGNSLSFAVLQSRYFRKAPSSFILSALSFVDSGVLLTGLLRHWIRMLTRKVAGEILDVRGLSLPGCKVHIYLTYFLPQLSSWSLVLMTLERLASVVIPLKSREICSRKRMIVAWVVVFVSLAVVNCHFFVVMTNVTTIDDNSCLAHPDHDYFFLKIWPWIDFALISLVPNVVIFISNAVIVVKLVKARKVRQQQMQVKEDDSSSITVMLVSISIVFLLTTTPVSIYFIGEPYWPYDTLEDENNTFTAYAVCNLIYYLSSSTNFLLYCLTGSRFRTALKLVVCCREPETKKSSTEQMAASQANNNSLSASRATVSTVI